MYDYKNKDANIETLNRYMLARTLSMFNYEGLPLSLPSVEIEKQLQKKGFTFITKVNDNLYALQGSLGGELNAYGEPTKIIINNPYINFSATLDIEKDGVFIKNDDMMLGLFPLYEKYNSLMIENEITMFLNSYNTRIQTLISAGDDSTKESAELYIKKIIEGELGIIGENRLFDGINVQTAQASNPEVTTQLIEFNQYLKATLYNEVGLNANFNMKRERLNSSEVNMNTENLHPLIDNMLLNREQGIQKLNEMYSLESRVEFGSIWKARNIDKEPLEENEPTNEDTEPIEEPTNEDTEPIEEPTVEAEEPTNEDTETAYDVNEIVDDEKKVT
jgi:hypothetical protein